MKEPRNGRYSNNDTEVPFKSHRLYVDLIPREGKFYETLIRVKMSGIEEPLWVSIYGQGNRLPSSRELELGWEEEHGWDHVETEAHEAVANHIIKALRLKNRGKKKDPKTGKYVMFRVGADGKRRENTRLNGQDKKNEKQRKLEYIKRKRGKE